MSGLALGDLAGTDSGQLRSKLYGVVRIGLHGVVIDQCWGLIRNRSVLGNETNRNPTGVQRMLIATIQERLAD